MISTARIEEIKTLGKTVNQKTSGYLENQPNHSYIISGSPLQPGSVYPDNDGDMLNNDTLDNYVYFLNRYPNRRVDAHIRPSNTKVDHVGIDFMVLQNRPWYVWFNASNTGVPQTNDWVESFGITNTQLFKFDDTVKVYYSTDGFKNVYSGYFSYEFPFVVKELRWHNSIMYNQFESSELGIVAGEFVGSQLLVSSMFIANVCQKKSLFLDLSSSIQYRDVYVRNPTLGVSSSQTGSQVFVMPRFGLNIEKIEKDYRFNGECSLEINPLWQCSNRKKIDTLGRFETSHHWQVFYWNVSAAVYLEPLLYNHLPKPFHWLHSEALANELAIRFRGQYAFNYRLIPQMKGVIGGFNTVRGYPEALTSGDSVYLTSIEYLLHLPRMFPPRKKPFTRLFGKPFYVSPRYPGGPVDWDLVFRSFLDLGNAVNNGRIAFEADASLVGGGMGLEILYRQNFSFRFDWGLAMKGVPILGVKANDNRFNYSLTLLY